MTTNNEYCYLPQLERFWPEIFSTDDFCPCNSMKLIVQNKTFVFFTIVLYIIIALKLVYYLICTQLNMLKLF